MGKWVNGEVKYLRLVPDRRKDIYLRMPFHFSLPYIMYLRHDHYYPFPFLLSRTRYSMIRYSSSSFSFVETVVNATAISFFDYHCHLPPTTLPPSSHSRLQHGHQTEQQQSKWCDISHLL